jgi:putative SOS response-associated peptidase YedK
MCGRFSLQLDSKALVEYFQLSHMDSHYYPRYNIAPGQKIAVIRQNDLGERYLEHILWGLIPGWSKDRKIANKLINARSETVDSKPTFRDAFKKRRCLIPADGFYEWTRRDGKQPFRIELSHHQPMAMAGLWEHWESPQSGELVESCTILTTQANRDISRIHDRMPVILPPQAIAAWMDGSLSDPATLKPLLQPYPGELAIYPVSSAVNNPRNDGPELLHRIQLDEE